MLQFGVGIDFPLTPWKEWDGSRDGILEGNLVGRDVTGDLVGFAVTGEIVGDVVVVTKFSFR